MTGNADEQHVDVDVVVVGAGFAGLAMVRKLVEMGFSVRGFERGSGVGGTWYWNRYPGARCDAPSMQYSYQFSNELQQDWHWTELYAAQPEILSYIEHVAERFDISRHFTFDTTVNSLNFCEQSNIWIVETSSSEVIKARFCIMATGNLSQRFRPDFKGLGDFTGEWYQTSAWPKEPVDFSGKRVGVIGTGSSGIQAIPVIAENAEHLTVFQRTPQYSVPARNKPTDPTYEARIKADYPGFRARNYRKPIATDIPMDPTTPKTFDVGEGERNSRYEDGWRKGGMVILFAFKDTTVTTEANEALSQYLREKIREVVDDPDTAARLTPGHLFGCKRPCMDTGYFETFNRSNVSLVDCSKGIERILPGGLVVEGTVHELDCIVFATGFDAITGALREIDISGRNSAKLSEKWALGPATYLGLQSAGFPNLFTISGPGSPSVLTNMVPTIEQHVNWIADALGHMRNQKFLTIETTEEVEKPWMDKVRQLAESTLWGQCDNWYVGANVPGKPRTFPIYVDWVSYLDKCNEVASNGYEGFLFS